MAFEWGDLLKPDNINKAKELGKKAWDAIEDKGEPKDEKKNAKEEPSPAPAQTQSKQTKLEEFTAQLNMPQFATFLESKGLNVSTAKNNDGEVTKDEAAKLGADLADSLIKAGYLKSDISAQAMEDMKTSIMAEFGRRDGAKLFNDMGEHKLNALVKFMATPEAEKKADIEKAMQDPKFKIQNDLDLSAAPTDQKPNYVLVDDRTGKPVLDSTAKTGRHEYIEVPSTPPPPQLDDIG